VLFAASVPEAASSGSKVKEKSLMALMAGIFLWRFYSHRGFQSALRVKVEKYLRQQLSNSLPWASRARYLDRLAERQIMKDRHNEPGCTLREEF